jgi:hypothetical protein
MCYILFNGKINNGIRSIGKKSAYVPKCCFCRQVGVFLFWNKIKKLLHLCQNIFFVCLVFYFVPSNKREYIISISPMTTKSYLCYWSEIGMFADERWDGGHKHLFFLTMQQYTLNFVSFFQLQINGYASILILISNNVEYVSLLVL